MAIHYGIIADFLNSRNDPANFDLVTVGVGTQVRYTVYQPATGDRTATVFINDHFATSPDLFTLGGTAAALPALVSAETVAGGGGSDGSASEAILRQKKLMLFVPPDNHVGSSFIFPLGDLGNTSGSGSGANLLVGNPTGSPMSITYQVNNMPQPFVTVDRGGCVAIKLNTAPAIVSVETPGNAVVALAIVGKGQDFAMTLIAPHA